MGGGAQAAGRGTGRVLPAWMTAQDSGDRHPAVAAAANVQHVQGQFDDAEQGGSAENEAEAASTAAAAAAAPAPAPEQAPGPAPAPASKGKPKKARKPRSAEQEAQYKAKNKQRH